MRAVRIRRLLETVHGHVLGDQHLIPLGVTRGQAGLDPAVQFGAVCGYYVHDPVPPAVKGLARLGGKGFDVLAFQQVQDVLVQVGEFFPCLLYTSDAADD